MAPIISIVGRSGSGKTTLIVKVVSELRKRGYSVGVLKHDAHGFEIDRAGKDSWRHKKAGAGTVALSSPEKFAVIKDVAMEWPPERIIYSYLSDADIVITEGYKKSDFPKIEVIRKANSKERVAAGDKTLMALVTDMKIKGKIPVYDLDDFKGVADIIEDKVIKNFTGGAVSLIVDGKHVPLKPFIDDLLREGVKGMIRSLKGCAEAEEIELRIRQKNDRGDTRGRKKPPDGLQ